MKTENIYLLVSGKTPASTIIQSKDVPSRRLLWYDEEKQKNRSLRYSSNQTSIFVDAQDDNVVLEPIVMEDGELRVPSTNHALIEFLEKHPDNKVLFYKWDPEADAEEKMNLENLILDAQLAARELSIDRKAAMLRIFTDHNPDKMDPKTINWHVNNLAKDIPQDFLDALDDPDLNVDDLAVRAIKDGFVGIRNNNRDIFYNLKDKKSKLMTIPLNETAEGALSLWFKTDDGLEFYQYLTKHYEE
jgi:hypothetical protein